jgi:uncharacterized membrane protein YozB (DUF420 family)
LLHAQGFFGTAANFAADATLVVMLLTASLFTLGAYLAVKGKYGAHRWIQTSATTLNTIMVGWMMILPFRDFVAPGLPERIAERFYLVTSVHAFLGASSLLLGIFVTLRANGLVPEALKFNNYKGYMRTSYTLFMLATLIGVLVYLSWFVWNPNPPTYG